MITMQEWKAMSGKEQTMWLEDNCQAGNRSLSKRDIVYGVGFNDSSYCTSHKIEGVLVKCPARASWASMMQRCFDAKFHERYPTYSGVSVSDNWHKFSVFRKWWLIHHVDGYELDKDLIGDGKSYSPESCIFVPQWLNKFTIGYDSARTEYIKFKSGNGSFRARCSNPFSRRQEFLGHFDTPEAAHLAWRARKLELALELKPRMDEIDQRIYPRVIEIINNAK